MRGESISALFGRCLGTLLEIRSCPGDLPAFNLSIVSYLNSLRVVRFSGRDTGYGLLRKLVLDDSCSGAGFSLG